MGREICQGRSKAWFDSHGSNSKARILRYNILFNGMISKNYNPPETLDITPDFDMSWSDRLWYGQLQHLFMHCMPEQPDLL